MSDHACVRDKCGRPRPAGRRATVKPRCSFYVPVYAILRSETIVGAHVKLWLRIRWLNELFVRSWPWPLGSFVRWLLRDEGRRER